MTVESPNWVAGDVAILRRKTISQHQHHGVNMSPCFLILLLLAHYRGCNANYFKEIEKMFVSEAGRQATNVLQEDLAGGEDQPKLITISYQTV